jgi:zinc protease
MFHRKRNVSYFLILLAFAVGLHVYEAPLNSWSQTAEQTASQASSLPAGVEKAASVEGLTEYHLSNGLRVLLFPEPSKPTITVNVTYLVGATSGSYGETGMAHLLEHLMFKGTPNHPDIFKELTEHGADSNGTTSYDRTNYYETFQATDENLEWALDMEADRMVNSFISKKDLDSEMTVVRNEFEMNENNPTRVLQQRVLSTAYLWHNYGKPTIGARSDIENVPIERLQAFYQKFYQPDNAVLIVAGKFDEAKALNLVVEKFGSIPKPTRTLPSFYTAEPIQDGERTVVLRRVGDTQFLFVVYHIPAGSHPDYVPLSLLTGVLADEPSGRLYKALVETKKASSIAGGSYELRNPGVAAFMAEVREENSLEEVRDILLDTVEKVAETPITSEELERQRTAALKYVDLVMNDTERMAMAISEAVALGDWRLLFLYRDRVKETTLEEIQQAAKYLVPSNRTLGMFYPTKAPPQRAEIPPTPDVASMVKDYKGSAKITSGEAFDPSVSNIEARTTRLSLPSGLKMALLAKKTRGETVTARMSLHFGDAQRLEGKNVVGDALGHMLMLGTKKHSRQEIQDTFDRLQAMVNVSGSVTGATASLETKREHLAEVLTLVAEILREPSIPESEFEPMRQEWLAGLEQERSDPQSLAIRNIQKYMSPYPKDSVRYIASLDERISDVAALDLENIREFYNEFYGGSDMELSIVGDFDEKEVRDLVKELFGNWPSPHGYTRVPSQYFDVPPVNRSIETPDKKNSMFLASLNLALQDDDPDFPALVLSNYMLGGGFLNSRLAVRIRQKEGLSYGVGSQFSASSLEKNANWLMYAYAAPQNVEKLEAVFMEEMNRAIRDGFSQEEIDTARSGYLQSRQNARADDGSLCGRLETYLFLDRTLAWDAELEKKIQSLTSEEVLAAMHRHLDLSKISIVKAGDFKNSEQSAVDSRQ